MLFIYDYEYIYDKEGQTDMAVARDPDDEE
jgi:hypothetical protein